MDYIYLSLARKKKILSVLRQPRFVWSRTVFVSLIPNFADILPTSATLIRYLVPSFWSEETEATLRFRLTSDVCFFANIRSTLDEQQPLEIFTPRIAKPCSRTGKLVPWLYRSYSLLHSRHSSSDVYEILERCSCCAVKRYLISWGTHSLWKGTALNRGAEIDSLLEVEIFEKTSFGY